MPGLPRTARLTALSITTFVSALLLQTGCTCGSGPYEGDYFDGDRPEPIQDVKFVESEKGDPKVIGCADGQREGFSDLKKHSRVAGCVGKWDGTKSLRDKPTGKACGDDGAACAVPADLCAPGWHVCGTAGKADDMTQRASAADCHNAGPGRFNAAVSHSPTDEINPCPKITKATKLPCVSAGLGAEPVCCGNDCLYGKCKDGVWRGKTKISRGTTEGCGAVTSERNGGVMCCFDGPGDPAAAADVEAKAPADGAEAGEAGAGPEDPAGAKAADGKTPADGKGGDADPTKVPGDAKSAGDAKKAAAKKPAGEKTDDKKAG